MLFKRKLIKRYPHLLRSLTILIFTAMFVSLTILKVVLPLELRKLLISQILINCKTCKADVKAIHISVLPVIVTLNTLSIQGGYPGDSMVEAHIPRVEIRVELRSLFSHVIQFNSIVMDRPEVILHEGNIYTPPANDHDPMPSSWAFQCDYLGIQDGTFNYFKEHQDRHPDQKSSIKADHIDVNVEPFGSTPSLRNQLTNTHVKGNLEHSGKVEMVISHVLFSKKIQVDVTVKIVGQDLAALNSYFDVNDGIHMKGMFIKGQSRVSIRDRNLYCWIRATYKGLKVKFRKMPERNSTEVLFLNFLSSLKIKEKNTNRMSRNFKWRVDLQRKPQESLVSLILRGMGTGALSVVTD